MHEIRYDTVIVFEGVIVQCVCVCVYAQTHTVGNEESTKARSHCYLGRGGWQLNKDCMELVTPRGVLKRRWWE